MVELNHAAAFSRTDSLLFSDERLDCRENVVNDYRVAFAVGMNSIGNQQISVSLNTL